MLVMPGAAALSRFRLDKLLAALQAIDPSVHSVAAYYSHFVDLSGELSPEDVSAPRCHAPPRNHLAMVDQSH